MATSASGRPEVVVLRDSSGKVDFDSHLVLLETFLARRKPIVDRIEALLNARRQPAAFFRDRALLARLFEDEFFSPSVVSQDRSALRGQLESAHWASGFRPRQVSGLVNDLIHPAEMMIRGFYCWTQTRWPGRNGRLRYANTLYDVYLTRCFELMSMRLWDAGQAEAPKRLTRLQSLLDALRKSAPADQPVLVRDARWLIPLAQSPTTDDLAPYFVVAEQVANSLDGPDRIESQKASVVMISGHLRSQIRHYCIKDAVGLDEPSIVRRTRTSNALDFALLVWGLVPLLEAYDAALESGDDGGRRGFASAILQGVSPDPDLFLSRIDLLGPYSMIDYLFVAGDGKDPGYTSVGERHVGLLEKYQELISRLGKFLLEDCRAFRPVEGRYSPFGAIFGTPSNLTEDMALKAVQRDAVTGFSLEDVFVDGGADKLAWVGGWRELPHIDGEIRKLYRYPQAFAEAVHERVERVLETFGSGRDAHGTGRTGRLYLTSVSDSDRNAAEEEIPVLPDRYLRCSDQQQLERDRLEGYFLASHATQTGWLALSKDLLTDILAQGQAARIDDLPDELAATVRLMCPGMAVS